MRRCRAENRVRPVQMPVDFLETPKKARQRTRTDGHMVAAWMSSPYSWAATFLT